MTDTMTDEEIQKLCDGATRGPWEQRADGTICSVESGHWRDEVLSGSGDHGTGHLVGSHDDKEFVAAARTLVPALLERAKTAERERDALRLAMGRILDMEEDSLPRTRSVRPPCQGEHLRRLSSHSFRPGISSFCTSE